MKLTSERLQLKIEILCNSEIKAERLSNGWRCSLQSNTKDATTEVQREGSWVGKEENTLRHHFHYYSRTFAISLSAKTFRSPSSSASLPLCEWKRGKSIFHSCAETGRECHRKKAERERERRRGRAERSNEMENLNVTT